VCIDGLKRHHQSRGQKCVPKINWDAQIFSRIGGAITQNTMTQLKEENKAFKISAVFYHHQISELAL
jgi:hypothetical protein